MKKLNVFCAAALLAVIATPVIAANYPSGSPREVRFQELAKRWQSKNETSQLLATKPHCAKMPARTPVIKSDNNASMKVRWESLTPEQRKTIEAQQEIARKQWQAMTPEQRKATEIRVAAARDTWAAMTPAERAAAKKRTLKAIEAAREKAKTKQKQ